MIRQTKDRYHATPIRWHAIQAPFYQIQLPTLTTLSSPHSIYLYLHPSRNSSSLSILSPFTHTSSLSTTTLSPSLPLPPPSFPLYLLPCTPRAPTPPSRNTNHFTMACQKITFVVCPLDPGRRVNNLFPNCLVPYFPQKNK